MHVDPVICRLAPAILYVGPDQLLPLTSILGAITGFLLIFWHRAVAAVRKVVGAVSALFSRGS